MNDLTVAEIISDLAQAFSEHGVSVSLVTEEPAEQNALGEVIWFTRAEVEQRILQRRAIVTFDGSMMELPDGTLDFIAPLETLISKGSLLKTEDHEYQVIEMAPRAVYGVIVCFEGKAERAGADGSR